MFRVIALDPGGTTGWATYTSPDREVQYLPPDGFRCGTLGPERHTDLLEYLLENQRVQDYIVVCERFTPRPENPGKDDISGRYQEVVELFCQNERIPLALQTPSQAKNFVTNSTLRRLGLWFPGRTRVHEMDAYRHLLWYLTNKLKYRMLLEAGWRK